MCVTPWQGLETPWSFDGSIVDAAFGQFGSHVLMAASGISHSHLAGSYCPGQASKEHQKGKQYGLPRPLNATYFHIQCLRPEPVTTVSDLTVCVSEHMAMHSARSHYRMCRRCHVLLQVKRGKPDRCRRRYGGILMQPDLFLTRSNAY